MAAGGPGRHLHDPDGVDALLSRLSYDGQAIADLDVVQPRVLVSLNPKLGVLSNGDRDNVAGFGLHRDAGVSDFGNGSK